MSCGALDLGGGPERVVQLLERAALGHHEQLLILRLTGERALGLLEHDLPKGAQVCLALVDGAVVLALVGGEAQAATAVGLHDLLTIVVCAVANALEHHGVEAEPASRDCVFIFADLLFLLFLFCNVDTAVLSFLVISSL